mmetsp:Transcript_12388/g.13355  ORF Transcript_12388/g.13355 Transcript_12388/m.13355 type:complete len:237 (-) Transcript_12388:627-1337(-)
MLKSFSRIDRTVATCSSSSSNFSSNIFAFLSSSLRCCSKIICLLCSCSSSSCALNARSSSSFFTWSCRTFSKCSCLERKVSFFFSSIIFAISIFCSMRFSISSRFLRNISACSCCFLRIVSCFFFSAYCILSNLCRNLICSSLKKCSTCLRCSSCFLCLSISSSRALRRCSDSFRSFSSAISRSFSCISFAIVTLFCSSASSIAAFCNSRNLRSSAINLILFSCLFLRSSSFFFCS